MSIKHRLLMMSALFGCSYALYFSGNFRKFIFTGAPKHWFLYVNKMLSSFVVESILHQETNQSILIPRLKFLSLSSETFYKKTMKVVAQKPTFEFNIGAKLTTIPAGVLLYDTSVSVCAGSFSCVLHFRQDKALWLNISFVQVYFASATGLSVYGAGYLKFMGEDFYYLPFIKTVWGIHSLFEVDCYNNVTLTVHANECFHVKLVYSVTDPDRIQSITNWVEPKSVKYVLFEILTKKLFYVHDLCLKKYQRITIAIKRDNVSYLEVRDGPGALSKLLHPYSSIGKYSVYQTSTFQSAIFTTLTRGEIKLFWETNWDCLIEKYVRPYETYRIPFSSKLSSGSVNIFHIYTEKHHSVQSSVQHILQRGRFSTISSCIHAGISIYDAIYIDIREPTSHCGIEYSARATGTMKFLCKHKSVANQRNVVYSGPAHGIWIVMYFFPEYVDHFEVDVQLSATNCEVIFIDVCKYQVAQTQTFLSQIGHQFIHMNVGECVVVQLFAQAEFKYAWSLPSEKDCAVKIRPGTIKPSLQLIWYNITGSLYSGSHWRRYEGRKGW